MLDETDQRDQEATVRGAATTTRSKVGAPGRTRTCGPLLSFQHQAFPDRPSKLGLLAGLYLGRLSPDPYSL